MEQRLAALLLVNIALAASVAGSILHPAGLPYTQHLRLYLTEPGLNTGAALIGSGYSAYPAPVSEAILENIAGKQAEAISGIQTLSNPLIAIGVAPSAADAQAPLPAAETLLVAPGSALPAPESPSPSPESTLLTAGAPLESPSPAPESPLLTGEIAVASPSGAPESPAPESLSPAPEPTLLAPESPLSAPESSLAALTALDEPAPPSAVPESVELSAAQPVISARSEPAVSVVISDLPGPASHSAKSKGVANVNVNVNVNVNGDGTASGTNVTSVSKVDSPADLSRK